MHVTLEKQHILRALSHAQSVVEKRHTLPILGHVLLQASDSTLTLTSTDMELNLIERIPATVEIAGDLTVSATMLFDITRKLDCDVIELTYKNNQLHVHGGRSKFKIGSLNATDFPKLSFDDLPYAFNLTKEQLKLLIDKPRFAMAVEEARYYLNGIYWHTTLDALSKSQVLRAVATDAHRLALSQIPAPEGIVDMPSVIIGRKAVNEVRKLLDEGDEHVHVKLSEQRIEFHFENASLSSRLIDGQFPDYMQAIPQHNEHTFYIPTKEYGQAVDRVATVVSDKLRVIHMALSENQIRLSALSTEMGSAQEDIPVAFDSQDTVDIGFNAKYLLDIIQHIDEEETEVSLQNAQTPSLIRGAGNHDTLYVLMPMRV